MSAGKQSHVLITGGAGYIGSLLTGELLRSGHRVTVLDKLLFGGDSLLPYLTDPNFYFAKTDVWEPRALKEAVRATESPPGRGSPFGCPRGLSSLPGGWGTGR